MGELKTNKKKIEIPYRKFSLRTLFLLKKIIKLEQIDIVHSHGNGAGLYSRCLKLLYPKVKVIHTFHGVTDSYSSLLKKIANKIINRSLRSFADKYIFVGKGEQELSKKIGFVAKNADNSVVIYNGIDDKSNNDFDRCYNNEQLSVITISRFDYQKNMEMAFEIAERLKDKNVKFVWVGDGENMQPLKEKAIEQKVNIEFTGFSNEPLKLLKQSDIYMSTSRFEGLPYALIEATSVGLPIVATNVCGNNEVVNDTFNGLLFNDVEQGVSSLIRVMDDRDLLKNMSENSRQFFEENFTIDKMISKIHELYLKVV